MLTPPTVKTFDDGRSVLVDRDDGSPRLVHFAVNEDSLDRPVVQGAFAVTLLDLDDLPDEIADDPDFPEIPDGLSGTLDVGLHVLELSMN